MPDEVWAGLLGFMAAALFVGPILLVQACLWWQSRQQRKPDYMKPRYR